MGSESDTVDRLEYPPLDGYAFRLMRILRNDGPGIECELANFPLFEWDENPYMALSYCWTRAPPRHRITVNNHPFMVRPNLFKYLQQAKKEGQHKWTFIDAICINQQDHKEKMRLISSMKYIYGGATDVAAWLGCEDIARMSVKKLSKLQHTCDQELVVETLDPRRSFNKDEKCFLSLITQCEYWQRLWVIQEIALAKKVIVRYGPLHMNAEALASHLLRWINSDSTHKLLDGTSLFAGVSVHGYPKLGNVPFNALMCHMILNVRSFPPDVYDTMYMKDIITAFASQRCTDPYDVVFGTLALSGSRIRANYTTPRIDFYLRALIEGLAGHHPQASFDRRSEETKSAGFCVALMARLGLRPDQPATAIITGEAWKRCGDGFEALSIPLRYARRASPLQRTPAILYLSSAAIWKFRGFLSEARIKRYKARQDSIPDPDNTMSKTYDGWVAFVDDKIRDILSRLPAELSAE